MPYCWHVLLFLSLFTNLFPIKQNTGSLNMPKARLNIRPNDLIGCYDHLEV